MKIFTFSTLQRNSFREKYLGKYGSSLVISSSLYLITLNGDRPFAAYHYLWALLKEMPILALKSPVCVFIFILK